MTLSRSAKTINKQSTGSAGRCAGQAYLSHLKGFLVHEVAQAGGSGEHVIALHRRNNVCKHRICPLRVPDGEDAALRAHLLVRSLICGHKALSSSKQGGCTEKDASHNACLSSGEPQGNMHTLWAYLHSAAVRPGCAAKGLQGLSRCVSAAKCCAYCGRTHPVPQLNVLYGRQGALAEAARASGSLGRHSSSSKERSACIAEG